MEIFHVLQALQGHTVYRSICLPKSLTHESDVQYIIHSDVVWGELNLEKRSNM